MRISNWIVTALAVTLMTVLAPAGTVPTSLSYQGRLTDGGGAPLNGPFTITFRIFNMQSGGVPFWSETRPVTVTDGIFSANLGSVQPIDPSMLYNPNDADENGVRYLEIQVADQPGPMSPRTLLVCSPYAMVAGSVANQGAILSASKLKLEDPVNKTKTEITPSLLELIRTPSPGVAGLEPLAFSQKSYFSLCSLAFCDTMGETLACVDGKTGTVALGSTTQSSLRLFDYQSGPKVKLAELKASGSAGPALDFFDQAGQVMGLEPSPFNGGFALRLIHPGLIPNRILAEVTSNYEGVASGASALRLFNVPPGGTIDSPTLPQVLLSSSIAGGEMRLGTTTDPASRPYIKCQANNADSRIDLYAQSVEPPGVTPTIALTVSASGAKVGIGTSTPSQALHVVGSICYTGGIDACSDERYKKNIETISGALATLERLRGVTYSWRRNDFPEMGFDDQRHFGFVAQEVAPLVPSVVQSDDEGFLSMDYSRITPLLVEAVKELKAENDMLQLKTHELDELRNEIAELRNLVAQSGIHK